MKYYGHQLLLSALLFTVPFFAASAGTFEEDYDFYSNILIHTAAIEQSKVEDLVSYLNENGIDPSEHSHLLNVPGFVGWDDSHIPNIGVSLTSTAENIADSSDDAYIFGTLRGELMPSTVCGECSPVSATGHSYLLRVPLSGLIYSGMEEAEASINILYSEGYSHFKNQSVGADSKYIVFSNQFKTNPEAMQGFLERFSDLGRRGQETKEVIRQYLNM